MYTLFGTKGSGSAAVEAALTLAAVAVPQRRCSVVGTGTRPRRTRPRQSAVRRFPTLRAARRLGADRERRHPDPPGSRASRPADCFPRTPRRARRPCAGSCTSRPTATPRSASSTTRNAGARTRTKPRASASGPAPRNGCMTCGRSLPTRFPRGRSWAASTSARSTCWPRWCRNGPGRASISPTARPEFSALLARIESDPRVAPIFARHWPPAA